MKLNIYAQHFGLLILAIGLATGCSSSGTSSETQSVPKSASESASDDSSVKQTIAAAKTALSTAVQGGYAWRDTGKYIKQAEKALAAGDEAKATTLANKALEQSELAKKQSIEQDLAIKERFN
jgi:hypothetical protein